MKRRDVLRLAGVGVLGALSGCSEAVHRARGVATPVGLVVTDSAGKPQSIAVRIERDGDGVFDGVGKLDGTGHVESIEGDDFENAEFSTAGTYTLTVKVGEQREQSTVDVSWQQLADCNSNWFEVIVREDDISIGLTRTDIGCPFPDNVGSGDR